MATKQRFSIASLLILVALIAAFTVIWLDRIELAKARETLAKRNEELGHIDISELAPNEGAIRHVPIEGVDAWKYRVFLPADHQYNVEYVVGDPANPKHYSLEKLNPSGQFSIVIHRAIDLYKPNAQPRECFVTSSVDDTNKAQSRLGIVWKPEVTAPFRDDLGHYTNVAGPNHRQLETFQIGKPVDLFRAAYSPKIPEGETLRIRLVTEKTIQAESEASE